MTSPTRICYNCGSSVIGAASFCANCAAPLIAGSTQTKTAPVYNTEMGMLPLTAGSARKANPDSMLAINVIRACGWLIFCGGLILGIMALAKSRTTIGFGRNTETVINTDAIIYGAVIIVGAIVGSAFLFVIADIAADLKDIKRNTSSS